MQPTHTLVPASFMPAVENELQRALDSQDPSAREMSRYLIKMGGKRIRPLLVMNAGAICGADTGDLAVVAAAAELVHTASLIHDDMVDGATSRRGSPTLHNLWGPRLSVLTGDFLFARAFSLLVKCKQFSVLRILADAVTQMCESEMEQMGRRFDLEMTQEECVEHARKKTASLIEACCKAGAVVGGAPREYVENLGHYGTNLGIAFQVTDDVLDLTGEDRKMGKPARLDVTSGVLTLPVLNLLNDMDRRERIRCILKKGNPSPKEVEEIRNEALESGAVDQAVSFARECVGQAIEALRRLPASTARDDLEKMARDVLAREV